MTTLIRTLPVALAMTLTLLSHEIAAADCTGEKIDPRWNVNENKPGSACHRQVEKVRKLEFDPRFECDKSIRQQWQREYQVAERMGCKL